MTIREDRGIGIKGWLAGPRAKGKSGEPTSEASVLDKRRIAILPFDNISPDPKDRYFADGLTEELISTVSNLRELSVISRTSVMRYKNHHEQVADIGQTLGVGTILEGSVRKAGNRVRISAQLIDVESDKHLWAENYDRNLEDVFLTQSEIADKVGSALKLKLLGEERAKIARQHTPSPEAYLLYMKGRAAQITDTKEGLETALEYYHKAIEKDPVYALAYARIADTHLVLGFSEIHPSRTAFLEAKTYAEKALEIDDSLAEVYTTKGWVHARLEWDYDAGERDLRRAIELNPNLAEAHSRLGLLLVQAHRFDEAISEVRSALALDPFSARTSSLAGTVFLYARHYDDALLYLKNSAELDPSQSDAVHNLGLTHVQLGEFEKGVSEMERASAASKSVHPLMMTELAYGYSKAGRTDDAKKILARLLEYSQHNPGAAANVAGVYASLGEKEEALKWLESAVQEHAGPLKAHLQVDFILDGLRYDPRFKEILKRVWEPRQ